MKEAVIVSIVRTAVGKAPRGVLRSTRPDDMAAAAIREALRRVPALDPAKWRTSSWAARCRRPSRGIMWRAWRRCAPAFR